MDSLRRKARNFSFLGARKKVKIEPTSAVGATAPTSSLLRSSPTNNGIVPALKTDKTGDFGKPKQEFAKFFSATESMKTLMTPGTYIQEESQREVDDYLAGFTTFPSGASFNSEKEKWESVSNHLETEAITTGQPDSVTPIELYESLTSECGLSSDHKINAWTVVVSTPHKGRQIFTAFFVPPFSPEPKVYPSGKLRISASDDSFFSEGMWWYSDPVDAKNAAVAMYFDHGVKRPCDFLEKGPSSQQLFGVGTEMLNLGNHVRTAIASRLYWSNYFADMHPHIAEVFFENKKIEYFSFRRNVVYKG